VNKLHKRSLLRVKWAAIAPIKGDKKTPGKAKNVMTKLACVSLIDKASRIPGNAGLIKGIWRVTRSELRIITWNVDDFQGSVRSEPDFSPIFLTF
jgi:hypothetical protein